MNSAKFFLFPILMLGISTGFSSIRKHSMQYSQTQQGQFQNQQQNNRPDQNGVNLIDVAKLLGNLAMDIKDMKKSLEETKQDVQHVKAQTRQTSQELSGLEKEVNKVDKNVDNMKQSFTSPAVQEAAQNIANVMAQFSNGLTQHSPVYDENIDPNSNYQGDYNKNSQQRNYGQFNGQINTQQNYFPTSVANDDDEDLAAYFAALK